MATETTTTPDLVVTREPVGPKDVSDPAKVGDMAVRDAVIIIAVAWAILFALVYSLRAHNI